MKSIHFEKNIDNLYNVSFQQFYSVYCWGIDFNKGMPNVCYLII